MLIGPEEMYSVPSHAFLISAKSLEWTKQRDLLCFTAEAVMVNKFTACITLAQGMLYTMFLNDCIIPYQERLGEDHRFTKIENAAGTIIWRQDFKAISTLQERFEGMPYATIADIALHFEGVSKHNIQMWADHWYAEVRTELHKAGYPNKCITLHFHQAGGDLQSPKIWITGDENALRAVHWKEKDRAFGGNRTVYVRLTSALFDKEWSTQAHRVMAHERIILSPTKSASIAVCWQQKMAPTVDKLQGLTAPHALSSAPAHPAPGSEVVKKWHE